MLLIMGRKLLIIAMSMSFLVFLVKKSGKIEKEICASKEGDNHND